MKLVKGAGAPGKGACYMSALNYYITNGATWSDQPECVSPLIRALAIRLNDSCESDEEREDLIGPHLFDPVGTAGDAALEHRRAFRCADMACRVWAPRALEVRGKSKWAAKLRALAPVLNTETAQDARRAAAAAAADNAGAHHAAYHAANAAAAAANAAAAADNANAASYAASYAAFNDVGRPVRVELRDLIVELCSWSDRVELDPERVAATMAEPWMEPGFCLASPGPHDQEKSDE